MFTIQPPQEMFDPDLRLENCREAVEIVLQRLIAEAETKGWQPAELALALADAAEDYVMRLAQKHIFKH
jgi:hypothetical protein